MLRWDYSIRLIFLFIFFFFNVGEAALNKLTMRKFED